MSLFRQNTDFASLPIVFERYRHSKTTVIERFGILAMLDDLPGATETRGPAMAELISLTVPFLIGVVDEEQNPDLQEKAHGSLVLRYAPRFDPMSNQLEDAARQLFNFLARAPQICCVGRNGQEIVGKVIESFVATGGLATYPTISPRAVARLLTFTNNFSCLHQRSGYRFFCIPAVYDMVRDLAFRITGRELQKDWELLWPFWDNGFYHAAAQLGRNAKSRRRALHDLTIMLIRTDQLVQCAAYHHLGDELSWALQTRATLEACINDFVITYNLERPWARVRNG